MRAAKLPENPTDGRTARRAVTRRAIFDAATTLFADKGVGGASIDEIAELAGTAKGSIFYNFDSKAGLVAELFEEYADTLAQAIRVETDGRHGRELQAGVVRALLSRMRANTPAARVIVSELFRVERDWAESVTMWREVATTPLVDDYIARHGKGARVRAQLMASSLVGATLMGGLEWLVFHPSKALSEVEAAIVSAFDEDAATAS